MVSCGLAAACHWPILGFMPAVVQAVLLLRRQRATSKGREVKLRILSPVPVQLALAFLMLLMPPIFRFLRARVVILREAR